MAIKRCSLNSYVEGSLWSAFTLIGAFTEPGTCRVIKKWKNTRFIIILHYLAIFNNFLLVQLIPGNSVEIPSKLFVCMHICE